MRVISIQLMQERSPELDVADAIARLTQVGQRAGVKAEMTEGDDDGPYVNLCFETDRPAELWSAIKAELN